MDEVSKLIKELKTGLWFLGFLGIGRFSREKAAEKLGHLGDVRAVDPLIRRLKDSDHMVRAEAAYALGKIGDARAVAPLCNCLKSKRDHKEWYTLTSYARALGDLGDARAVKPLCILLNRKLPLYDTVVASHVQIAIIEALAKIGDVGAVGPLNQVLEKEFTFLVNVIHRKAAVALGQIGSAGSSESLAKVALDRFYGDESVRENAVEALGKIGDRRAVEGIIEVLKVEVQGDIRTKAEEALENISDTEALEVLIKIVESEPNVMTCVAVAGALGKIGDARAVEPLCVWLKHKESYVSYSAAEALREIGDVRAVEPLCELLESLNVNDRLIGQRAAEALGEIGDARAIEPILRASVRGVSGCSVGLDCFQPLDVGTKFESLGLLREADVWYTRKGLFEEAAAVRKIIAEMGGAKVSQKVVHGDESSDLVEQLKGLSQLKTDGMLTGDEFNEAKRKLLRE